MVILTGGYSPNKCNIIIQNFISFMWTLKYNDMNECELYIKYDKNIFNSIAKGMIIFPLDDPDIGYCAYEGGPYTNPAVNRIIVQDMHRQYMIIYSCVKYRDANYGDCICIKAHDILYILKQRACCQAFSIKVATTLNYALTRGLYYNAGSHAGDPCQDKIVSSTDVSWDNLRGAWLTYNSYTGTYASTTVNFIPDPRKSVWDNLLPLLKQYNIGITCHNNHNASFSLPISWEPRKIENEPAIVIDFKDQYDASANIILNGVTGSIISSEYGWSNKDKITIGYPYLENIWYKEGIVPNPGKRDPISMMSARYGPDKPKRVGDIPTPWNIYEEAKDFNIEYKNENETYRNYYDVFNEATAIGSGETKDLSNTIFSATINPKVDFPKLGIDYGLGELILLDTDDFRSKAYLSTVTYSYSQSGFEINPEFIIVE